jgi:uroporphyrin-III C-methyltransferase
MSLSTSLNTNSHGEVYLVGAGPGDPELLTIKAMRALNQADCVLYDSLISTEILDLIPRKCVRIHVGKRCGDHKMGQADIQSLLVSCARKYQHVVRLKGGDPFIFGRGGEELEYLRNHQIRTHVVAGISAAIGCAAAAQIPLTHRQMGNALFMQSGHSQYGDFELADNPTRVFYMGRKHAGAICARLLMEGVAESTPVALIANGTLPQQQVLKGVLADLPLLASHAQDGGPLMIVVGEVAALACNETVDTADQQTTEAMPKTAAKAATPGTEPATESLREAVA